MSERDLRIRSRLAVPGEFPDGMAEGFERVL